MLEQKQSTLMHSEDSGSVHRQDRPEKTNLIITSDDININSSDFIQQNEKEIDIQLEYAKKF